MANLPANEFAPDYAVPPGEILEETLMSRGIKKVEFAERCDLSAKTISLIIGGKAPVTSQTAIQFERVLGVSAAVWNNLESYYRLHLAEQAAHETLKSEVAWAKRFPVRELVERGCISQVKDDVDAVEKLLNFFAVGSVKAWNEHHHRLQAAFRGSPSFKSAPGSVVAWLRIGELAGDTINTEPYDRKKFVAALHHIRTLTQASPEQIDYSRKEWCRQAGVALALEPELPGTRLNGATRWLTSDKALIMLSLRYKWEDIFWFTFFHEAAHILLHGKRNRFLENQGVGSSSDEEEAADYFAADLLIPPTVYQDFVRRGKFYREDILAFAKEVDIAPGIVVGRLQHDGHIQPNWQNGLRRRFQLKAGG